MTTEYRKANEWWQPGDNFVPEGYVAVPPGTRMAPDGVYQGWTVVQTGHPDARLGVSNKRYKAAARRMRGE